MAAGGGLVVRVWKEWGIQILVVASFLLQLILLVFSGFRRRSSSGVLLAFLWLSYLMADNMAVYALGHMSLESRPGDDGLIAFWATFFLLHLGGQDTITAFSLEDNQLSAMEAPPADSPSAGIGSRLRHLPVHHTGYLELGLSHHSDVHSGFPQVRGEGVGSPKRQQ
uniref:DUF4220 domain-containing protein n=1 Tax=Triticum urartu TaxID=4572 RepID=A0A8R7VF79_TRIUA